MSAFPPQWLVAPASILDGTSTDDEYHCPSTSQTFITFGITNGIVALLSILAGCRPLLHFLTCHLLFKPGKKNKMRTAWILPFLFTLAANATLGAIIHNTPGYQNVEFYNVMLIYLVRPRISMMALLTLTYFWRIKGEYAWLAAFLGSSVAESFLQIIATIWVLEIGVHYSAGDIPTLVIIGLMGADLGLTVLGLRYAALASRPHDATGGDLEITEFEGRAISHTFGTRFKVWVIVMLFILPGYLLGRIFFYVFLSRTEGEWCPPKLGMHVLVWSGFAVLGTLTGSGM